MADWRKLPPIFDPSDGQDSLVEEGKLFSADDRIISNRQVDTPHWHDTYEIGYFLTGRGVIMLDNEEYPYRPGQVYIVNNLEPHMGYAREERSTLFNLHIHPGLFEDSLVSRIYPEIRTPFLFDWGEQGAVLPMESPLTEIMRTKLEKIRRESMNRSTGWEIVVSGLLLEIAGHLVRYTLSLADTPPEIREQREARMRIDPVIRFIEAEYNQPISLDDMADIINISRSYCSALFKKALGISPIAYRNHRRLAEARRMLQFTPMSICQIAYQVGFSSTQEFNRLFRREHLMTPGQFRELTSEAQQ